MLDFGRDGAALVARTIAAADVDALRAEFSGLDFRAGSRPFSPSGLVRKLIGTDGCFGQAMRSIGHPPARAVRILAFDKTPDNNWNLGWHQDRVIAVKHKLPVEGFGTWTVKNGVPHVEAPESLLKHIVFLRLHLDPCPAENGALKIVPGSAELGKLTDAESKRIASNWPSIICEAAEGEILVVKALTLHASEPAATPSHRRVLHVDFCSCELPEGLSWALEPSGPQNQRRLQES